MKIGIAILAMAFASSAVAKEPAVLDGLVKTATTSTGTCGAASVRVSGISEHGWIPYDGGQIEITTAGKTETITAENGKALFQDWNYLACADGKTGRVIVIEGVCSGRSCNPSDFTVIEASSGRTLTPLTSDDGCDRDCATRAIGSPPPTRPYTD